VSRKKTKDKGAAKKSGKDTKKNKSTKNSKKKSTKRPPKRQAEKPGKERVQKNQRNDAKKPVNMVQARENVSDLVRKAAAKIAKGMIAGALDGQLASAKYLFEAVGLYPPTEQTQERPDEDSLAHTLLRRMGLPLEPLVIDDDDAQMMSSTGARGMDDESLGKRVERQDALASCVEERPLVEGSKK
jgi:hypothetical protein